MNENVIGKEVVDVAVKVHRELGPGLLEAVYEVGWDRTGSQWTARRKPWRLRGFA